MKLNNILHDLYFSDIINTDTIIYLREGSNIIARAKQHHDNIVLYKRHEVLCFAVNLETNTLSVKLRGAD